MSCPCICRNELCHQYEYILHIYILYFCVYLSLWNYFGLECQKTHIRVKSFFAVFKSVDTRPIEDGAILQSIVWHVLTVHQLNVVVAILWTITMTMICSSEPNKKEMILSQLRGRNRTYCEYFLSTHQYNGKCVESFRSFSLIGVKTGLL